MALENEDIEKSLAESESEEENVSSEQQDVSNPAETEETPEETPVTWQDLVSKPTNIHVV